MKLQLRLIVGALVMVFVAVVCISLIAYMTPKDASNDGSDVLFVPSYSENDSEIITDSSTENSLEIIESESRSESSEEYSESEESFNEVLVIPDGVEIKSPNVIVYNLTKQYPVYSNIMYTQCAPASLTKMLTALVALDYFKPDDALRVGDEIDKVGQGSTVAFLAKGQRYRMSTLLDALFLPSGNDVAYTLAVNTARVVADDNKLSIDEAVSDFVRLMNAKAKALGCTMSNFASPDGYDTEGQYTSTEDILTISIAAYSNPYIKTATAKSKSGNWVNTNLLIREDSDFYNPCVNGLKTGSTDAAGYCLSASAVINNDTYIIVLMKGQGSFDRFVDANTIISLLDKSVPNDESVNSSDGSELSAEISQQ